MGEHLDEVTKGAILGLHDSGKSAQDPDLVNSLIESMPRRINEVIDNNGRFTSY